MTSQDSDSPASLLPTSDGNAYTHPLTYPGTWPTGSGMLVDGRFDTLEPAGMDRFLRARNLPVLADRQPLLAVGSNAAPAQLRTKFSRAGYAGQVVPMTLVEVRGLVPGVSAHVSRPGFVPATPVPTAGTSSLFVVWLTPDQLAIVDATEPSYDRVPLGAEFPVSAEGSFDCDGRVQMYTSRHGFLLDPSRTPRRLRPQRDLIQDLLAESDALRDLAGPTPDQWLEAMRDPLARRRARDIWADEGRVRPDISIGSH